MNKPHKHAEIIKAWADGAEIQYWSKIYNCWVDSTDPIFCDLNEYRKKPDPITQYINIYRNGKHGGCSAGKIQSLFKCQISSSAFLRGTIKLLIDGETGKLKSAEVINNG